MDAKTRTDAADRLKRIAGQVAGIQRMLDENRYCVDVLLQIAAIQGALGEVGRVVLVNHVQTCVTKAAEAGSAKERDAKMRELVDLFARSVVVGVSGRGKARARKAPRKG